MQLGYVINALWGLVAVFSWLYIFNLNVLSLGVTWLSFMVSFSFMFNTSAQSFVEVSAFIIDR